MALGVLGMPGMTAYMGLMDIGQPKAGETLVVAAASGAVGSVVGQVAKIKGLRVVGVAGGADKCRYVVDELGFDACIDHKSADFADELAQACPKGIDIYYENVGGKVFDAVVPLLNPKARIPLCGLIAAYNAHEAPSGPDRLPLLQRTLLTKRVRIQGFIVFDDYGDRQPEFLSAMAPWVRDGKVKFREDVVDGLEHAPEAFIGLLEGRNFGKLVVRVAQDCSDLTLIRGAGINRVSLFCRTFPHELQPSDSPTDRRPAHFAGRGPENRPAHGVAIARA